MKLVIAQGTVKRTLEGAFSLCCGLSDMDNLIQELQFARAGMAASGGVYGWVRIDPSHPCDPSSAGPPLPWGDKPKPEDSSLCPHGAQSGLSCSVCNPY